MDWPEIVKVIAFGSGFVGLYVAIAHAFQLRGYVLAKETLARVFGKSGRAG